MALRLPNRLGLLLSLLVCVAFVFPNEAAGQTKTEVEMARSLMDEGDAQLERGDAKGALRSYRAAHTIMNVPTTGIEVARMEAKLRHLVEARKVALEVAHMPVKPREPKPFTEARSDAQLLADALETRIPRLTIEMKGALSTATVELKIDGRILPSEEIRDPIPVDPGKHEVVLVPSGGEPESRTVTVSENEKRTLTFGDGSASSDTDKPVRRTSPLVFVGFGLGGVGLIAGAITGGLSLSGASEVEKICPKGTCPSQTDINQAKPIHDRAYTLANVSNVAFALGVVGVGLGVTGLLSRPAADKKPESETAFRVFVGPNGALVRGSF